MTAGRPSPSFVEAVLRFGLASADVVVDRYVRLADGVLPSGVPAPPDASRVAEGVAGMTVAWLRLLDTTASLLDGAASTTGVETLVLPRAVPGSSAESSLWLHGASSPAERVVVHGTDLLAADGGTVPASALSFDHPVPPAAGAPRELRVRVQVPDGQPGGRYCGLLLATTAALPMVLVLDVAAGGGR